MHHERRVKRERNQQDATNLIFIIKLLSQHVSGIIMPIIRRTRVCTAAYGVLYWLCWLRLCGAGTRAVCTVVHCRICCSALAVLAVVVWSWDASCVHCETAPHNQSHHNLCRILYAAVHTRVLLMMGIMMPEICCDKSLIINIRLVASCWFLSLHPTFSAKFAWNISHSKKKWARYDQKCVSVVK